MVPYYIFLFLSVVIALIAHLNFPQISTHEQDWAEVIITPGGKCDKVIEGLVSHDYS